MKEAILVKDSQSNPNRNLEGGILKRSPGGGILEKESPRRNPEQGILKEESLRRNPRGGTLEEESCWRNPEAGILKEEPGRGILEQDS